MHICNPNNQQNVPAGFLPSLLHHFQHTLQGSSDSIETPFCNGSILEMSRRMGGRKKSNCCCCSLNEDQEGPRWPSNVQHEFPVRRKIPHQTLQTTPMQLLQMSEEAHSMACSPSGVEMDFTPQRWTLSTSAGIQPSKPSEQKSDIPSLIKPAIHQY